MGEFCGQQNNISDVYSGGKIVLVNLKSYNFHAGDALRIFYDAVGE